MSGLFYMGDVMALEEKRAWIMLMVSVCAYAAYLIAVLGRTGALAEEPYAGTLLWSIGGAIAVSIVLNIAAVILAPAGARTKDQRDREINRVGEHIGQSFVVIGGLAALLLALAEADHFWIANVIYLAFVLSAVLGSVAKIFAYRRGFQSW
jgi:cell division protein FtsW (lipid II flippase)